MHIINYISWLQIFFCLINCTVGFRMFNKKSIYRNEILYIFPFCILDLITSLGFRYLIYSDILNDSDFAFGIANLIFVFGEVILLPSYIKKTISQEINWLFPTISVISLSIISYFLTEDISSLSQIFSGLYITYYIIKYFHWLFTTKKIFNLSSTTHFWIILGLMVAYTASIPACIGMLFTDFFPHINTNRNFSNTMLSFFTLLNISMHILFTKAFTWKWKLKLLPFVLY